MVKISKKPPIIEMKEIHMTIAAAITTAQKSIDMEDVMQLYERLDTLVGHEVSTNSTIGAIEQSTNEGILMEVGEDYIVIKPFDSPDWPLGSIEEYSGMGGHWFLKLNDAMPIVHGQCCTKCKAESTAPSVA
jgi:hypothetical protein